VNLGPSIREAGYLKQCHSVVNTDMTQDVLCSTELVMNFILKTIKVVVKRHSQFVLRVQVCRPTSCAVPPWKS
jgi:hypothetical protein